MATKRIVVGVTGASGGPYAVRLIDCLEAAGVEVHLIVSPLGRRLLAEECGIKELDAGTILGRATELIHLHAHEDVGSMLASGSCHVDGMAVCPCSSHTLGAMAAGLGDNLITRAAYVTLKEARRLIVVHREMPVTGIDLENMLRLQRAGAIICPAAPGFYMGSQSVQELVDVVVGRLLDLLHVPHDLNVRWDEKRG